MSRRRTARHAATLTVTAALTFGLGACTMGHDSGTGGSAGKNSGGSSGAPSSSSSSSSSSDPTAESAFDQMQGSVKKATSASVEAHGLIEHQQSTLTLSGDLDNDPTKTHAVMGTNGTADLITIGQDLYVKGDTSYWEKAAKAPQSEASHLSGKWFKAPKSAFGSSINSLTPKSLTDEITDDNGNLATKFQSSGATLKKTTYENKPAYELTGDDGKTKVWCSADGKYTLFKVDQPDDPDDFTSATFKDWNTKPSITAPKGAITLPGHGGSGHSGGSGGSGSDGGTTT